MLTTIFRIRKPRFIYFFLSFCLFRAIPKTYESSQARGQIRAVTAGIHHGHSNARSLTHWTRPGIKPTSSWMLVRFLNHWGRTGTLKTKILYILSNGKPQSIPQHIICIASFDLYIFEMYRHKQNLRTTDRGEKSYLLPVLKYRPSVISNQLYWVYC